MNIVLQCFWLKTLLVPYTGSNRNKIYNIKIYYGCMYFMQHKSVTKHHIKAVITLDTNAICLVKNSAHMNGLLFLSLYGPPLISSSWILTPPIQKCGPIENKHIVVVISFWKTQNGGDAYFYHKKKICYSVYMSLYNSQSANYSRNLSHHKPPIIANSQLQLSIV